jgi:predicted small lipoprotein YifL
MIQKLFKEVFSMRRCFVLALLVVLSGCGKKVELAQSDLTERDRDLYTEAMKSLEKSRLRPDGCYSKT